MIIGIIFAIKKEALFFLKKIKIVRKKKVANICIYHGKIKKKAILVVICEIGKVSASIATTYIIVHYSIKIIINAGSCGSLKKKTNIGEIFIPKKICYHDVNLTNFNYKIGQVPNCPKNFINNLYLFKIAKKCAKKLNYVFKTGLLLTGDIFIYKKKKIKKIKKNFHNPIAIDMESAAIAQVCFKFKKPIFIIRCISDYANSNSTNVFKKNISNISKKIFYILKKLLNYI